MLHHEESQKNPQYNMSTPQFCLTPPLPFLAKIFRPPHFHQFWKNQTPLPLWRGDQTMTFLLFFTHFWLQMRVLWHEFSYMCEVFISKKFALHIQVNHQKGQPWVLKILYQNYCLLIVGSGHMQQVLFSPLWWQKSYNLLNLFCLCHQLKS